MWNNNLDQGCSECLANLMVTSDKNYKYYTSRNPKQYALHLCNFFVNLQAMETKLEMLNIGYNCLLDTVASSILMPMKQNKNLVRLGLQSTQITCKGAKCLAEALETNTTLQVNIA